MKNSPRTTRPRSHHAIPPPPPDPTGPRPHRSNPDVFARLLKLPRLRPHLTTVDGLTCEGCGADITPGETHLARPGRYPRNLWLCHACGTSYMLWAGWWTDAQALACPPYGGGPPTPAPPSPAGASGTGTRPANARPRVHSTRDGPDSAPR
jgi:hypothetical protein